MADFKVKRGQLDALWTYVGNKGKKRGYPETEEKGEFWRSTYMDTDSRLRVAREQPGVKKKPAFKYSRR